MLATIVFAALSAIAPLAPAPAPVHDPRVTLVAVEGYVTEIEVAGFGRASITPTPIRVVMDSLFGNLPPQTLRVEWKDSTGATHEVVTPCVNFLTQKDCLESHLKMVNLYKTSVPPAAVPFIVK